MEIDILQLLHKDLTLTVFAVIALGYLIARIRIKGIDLGSTTGVLLAGLFLGHFGIKIDEMVGTFGFILFIFSIGLQAGPSFFSVFVKDGAKYFLMAAIVAFSAFGLTRIIAWMIDLDFGLQAGLLAGALTSTPTLAGAQDAIRSGLANLPEGFTQAQIMGRISVAYAITYVLGTIGVIFFIRLLPVLTRADLPAEAKKIARSQGLLDSASKQAMGKRLPVIRAYRIPKSLAGKTIEQAVFEVGKHVLPLKVRRDNKVIDAEAALELHEDDIISVVGALEHHMQRGDEFGTEILDPELLNYQIVTKEIVVTKTEAEGKTLAELDLVSQYGCFVRAVIRASIDLPVDENMMLNKGDRLFVTGEEEHLIKLAQDIGRLESEVIQTNLLSLSFGIATGVLLGMVTLKIGWFSIVLGSAAGLLLIGILIGFLRAQHPTFGGVPPAAREILRELGLALFMASVGVNAGAHIVETLMSIGVELIIAGLVVTIIPIIIGYFFGRTVLKLNPVLLLGSLTGAMTSTPSLNVITKAANSEVPALGYAGTYTFANVLLTFAGSLMMII